MMHAQVTRDKQVNRNVNCDSGRDRDSRNKMEIKVKSKLNSKQFNVGMNQVFARW